MKKCFVMLSCSLMCSVLMSGTQGWGMMDEETNHPASPTKQQLGLDTMVKNLQDFADEKFPPLVQVVTPLQKDEAKASPIPPTLREQIIEIDPLPAVSLRDTQYAGYTQTWGTQGRLPTKEFLGKLRETVKELLEEIKSMENDNLEILRQKLREFRNTPNTTVILTYASNMVKDYENLKKKNCILWRQFPVETEIENSTKQFSYIREAIERIENILCIDKWEENYKKTLGAPRNLGRLQAKQEHLDAPLLLKMSVHLENFLTSYHEESIMKALDSLSDDSFRLEQENFRLENKKSLTKNEIFQELRKQVRWNSCYSWKRRLEGVGILVGTAAVVGIPFYYCDPFNWFAGNREDLEACEKRTSVLIQAGQLLHNASQQLVTYILGHSGQWDLPPAQQGMLSHLTNNPAFNGSTFS